MSTWRKWWHKIISDLMGKTRRASQTEQEGIILKNLVDLREKTVQDVMIPRADVVGISASLKPEDAAEHFRVHSRLPVYQANLDEIVHIVHLRDCLSALLKKEKDVTMKDLGIEPPCVPPQKRAVDMLFDMRRTRQHMAIVVDEYGGTLGIVTIEDIIEEIVGEIEDEHDSLPTIYISRNKDSSLTVNGRMKIEEFKEYFNLSDSLIEDYEEDIETVGGFLCMLLGRLPKTGEVVTHRQSGLVMKVTKATSRAIKEVNITQIDDTSRSAMGKQDAGTYEI